MNEVINVENLGKKYIISHQGSANDTFREVITENAKKIFKNNLFKKSSKEEFWALKNVSFQVNQGERIGIIGRNGAGKSTLLKLLSRITEPTEGRIKIKGKIASLLEVGTGFHPELTGRENIYLNGAVLGMSRSEIKRKFDDIVEFSGVEQFLDTPVKRYSSGMYVRLAFAVAAHLETEILLIDEVLAVGDIEFQKKCLGKMDEISKKEGRTIIFVSHNMSAIENLCARCILIDNGFIKMMGETKNIVNYYIEISIYASTGISIENRIDRKGNGYIRFCNVKFLNEKGEYSNLFRSGENIEIILNYKNMLKNKIKSLDISIGIDNSNGERIALISNAICGDYFNDVSEVKKEVVVKIKKIQLSSGTYYFTLFSSVNGEIADWVQNAGVFYIESGDYYGTGKSVPMGQGSLLLDYSFDIR